MAVEGEIRMAYIYCTATNTGKGFFTHQDNVTLSLKGTSFNIWRVPEGAPGDAWISRVSGTKLSTAAAQKMLDDVLSDNQAAWDADPILQGQNARPVREVLE